MSNEQISDNQKFVKVPREFGWRAVRDDVHLLYRFHVLLQSFDKDGKGYVMYKPFIDYLRDECGFTDDQYYAAFNDPASEKFFKIGRNRETISYVSRKKLQDIFDSPPGNFALINPKNFVNPEDARAWLYSCLFNPEEGTNLSREKIEELTKVSKSSQIRYEKIAGITKQLNMVQAEIPEEAKSDPEKLQEFYESLPLPKPTNGEEGSVPVAKNGSNVRWQTSNTYRGNYAVKKANRGSRRDTVKRQSNNKKKQSKPAINAVSSAKVEVNREDAGEKNGGIAYRRVFYDNPNDYSGFAKDDNGSFLYTGRRVNAFSPHSHGRLYSYNKFVPTNKQEKSVAYAFLDENGFVRVADVKAVQNTLAEQNKR